MLPNLNANNNFYIVIHNFVRLTGWAKIILSRCWKTMIDEGYWFGFNLLAPERLWCLFELAAFLKSKDIGPDVSWLQGFKGVTVVTWKCGLVWTVHWPCFLFCSFSTIGRHLIELVKCCSACVGSKSTVLTARRCRFASETVDLHCVNFES